MLNPVPLYNELCEEYEKIGESAAGKAWFWTKYSITAICWIFSFCMILGFLTFLIYLFGRAVYELRYLFYLVLSIFASLYLAFKAKLSIKKFRANKSVAQ